MVESRFSVPEHVVFRELDGETVLLHLISGRYFGLDPIGTQVLRTVALGQPPAVALPALLEEYEVSEQQLRQDVEELLSDLLSRGVLTREHPSPP